MTPILMCSAALAGSAPSAARSVRLSAITLAEMDDVKKSCRRADIDHADHRQRHPEHHRKIEHKSHSLGLRRVARPPSPRERRPGFAHLARPFAGSLHAMSLRGQRSGRSNPERHLKTGLLRFARNDAELVDLTIL